MRKKFLIALWSCLLVLTRGLDGVRTISEVARSDSLKVLFSTLAVTSLQTAERGRERGERIHCFFVPGFQLDRSYYGSIAKVAANEASIYFHYLDGPEHTSAGTIEDASALMVEKIRRSVAGWEKRGEDRLVLMGHSRGAAVAALALLGMQAISFDGNISLIQVDPVDDSRNTAIRALHDRSNRAYLDKISSRLSIFIMSLSYGGYSSYYKQRLVSSCAPEGRNADSFVEALPADLRILQKEYREVGHMQFLDRSVNSETSDMFSAVCPRSEAGEKRVEEVRQQLREWILRS